MEQKHEHKVEIVGVDVIKPHPHNSNKHPEDQLKQIIKSIREFGFTRPILINASNVILAGHGAFAAVKRLKMHDVPCIRLTHLTEAQERAYVIADNRIQRSSEWDFDVLAAEIDWLNDGGFDVSTLGFSDAEFAELIGTPNAPPEDDEGDAPNNADDKEAIICPRCSHEFVL